MATLKTQIREYITLNGDKYDSSNNLDVESINEVSKRIITVPVTEQDLINISGSVGSGAFITEDVRYVRITNIGNADDHKANVTLTFKSSDSDEFAIKLAKGNSYIYNGISGSGLTNTMDATGSAGLTHPTTGSLSNITAYASGAACNVEYFIASN